MCLGHLGIRWPHAVAMSLRQVERKGCPPVRSAGTEGVRGRADLGVHHRAEAWGWAGRDHEPSTVRLRGSPDGMPAHSCDIEVILSLY